MTLATSYHLDPDRLARILASMDLAAVDSSVAMVEGVNFLDARHKQLADLTLLHGWLRALQVEGHLELEVTE